MTTLDYQLSDGVATLTMNRPEARNALSTAMKDDFARLVPQMAADPAVKAVILTGANGTFCAGGDLRGMAEADGLQSSQSINGLAAQEIPPEIKILQHRQGGFERIAVAEVMCLFGQGQFRFAAFQRDGAPGGGQQACDQADRERIAPLQIVDAHHHRPLRLHPPLRARRRVRRERRLRRPVRRGC